MTAARGKRAAGDWKKASQARFFQGHVRQRSRRKDAETRRRNEDKTP